MSPVTGAELYITPSKKPHEADTTVLALAFRSSKLYEGYASDMTQPQSFKGASMAVAALSGRPTFPL